MESSTPLVVPSGISVGEFAQDETELLLTPGFDTARGRWLCAKILVPIISTHKVICRIRFIFPYSFCCSRCSRGHSSIGTSVFSRSRSQGSATRRHCLIDLNLVSVCRLSLRMARANASGRSRGQRAPGHELLCRMIWPDGRNTRRRFFDIPRSRRRFLGAAVLSAAMLLLFQPPVNAQACPILNL